MYPLLFSKLLTLTLIAMTIREEISLHEQKIASLATQLRCELEELSNLVNELWILDEEYTTPTGNDMDCEEIQDLANEVSEIEQEFNEED